MQGTGKTFLGVKIAELLLYNRSVWCPPGTENTPILMVCQTNHALDQFLEHIITQINMEDGLIRVGGRCKNERILPFSLVKVRQYYRERHLIPSIIHQQKRDIIQRKFSSESAIQSNEQMMNVTYLHLNSLGLLKEKNIIKTEHLNSLIGGSGYCRSMDTILNEWLGFNEQVIMINSIDDEFEQMGIDENQFTPEDDNEEQEEEQRRRDEIDIDEDFFGLRKITPKLHLTSNVDDDLILIMNGKQQLIKMNKNKLFINYLIIQQH